MENIFITKLILEKVRNLDHIEIPLSKDKKKHLIFTGRNGSGKTTIRNGLSEYINDDMTAMKKVFSDAQMLEELEKAKGVVLVESAGSTL